MLLITVKFPHIHCWPLNHLVDLWAQEKKKKKSYIFFSYMYVSSLHQTGFHSCQGWCLQQAITVFTELLGEVKAGFWEVLFPAWWSLTNLMMRVFWKIHYTSWLCLFSDVPTDTQLFWTVVKLYDCNHTSRWISSARKLLAWISKAELYKNVLANA